MRIQQLDLWNFKAFEQFTMTLGTNAFLVGPNNAGKSTLISAARVAAGMLEHATRRKPTGRRAHGHRHVTTHSLRADQYGLVTENLRHQFRSGESAVSLRTDTDLILTGVWPSEDDVFPKPFFYLRRSDGRNVSQPIKVRELTGQIGIIPGLYPINHTETVLQEEYVRSYFQRSRSSQHARNQLLLIRRGEEFEDFIEFVNLWLPEIEELSVTTRPGKEPGDREIDVFVRERGDRTRKELFWVGDGMQIFVQILTHLWRLRSADVVILDEPDLYLHADLQRRLVRLLDSTAAQTITATHSSEMLAEASSESVVWVDKTRRRAIRRPKPASLEDLSAQIGSSFNLRLATALRARTVVFVEGDDMSIIRELAKTIGADHLAGERNCAVIEIKGFTNWVRVEPFKWFVSDFLDGAVEVFVLLDRDYRADADVDQVRSTLEAADIHAHVWRRKELESYLLDPTALARVSDASPSYVSSQLESITDAMTEDVLAQFAEKRHFFSASGKKDIAGTIRDTNTELRPLVVDPMWRLHRYPAKEILTGLNGDLQRAGHTTVSAKNLARQLLASEIPEEMRNWLYEVDSSIRR
ncbi:MAG: AAA family ATPase [Acidimicrobiaceae bacterium]|nr:AAA family ATPase [Acidimicrobiaceae bacterium]MXZ67288.1 AAA family ATPase [Acidimicrobiaceae bacterium]MYF32603.1 AAA family ATPase [Acidimicrobiaceae bacterium]MYG78656.1 AAA family ATPase [Acidimicrobiaceae bacterium]MYJ84995.1 AAA family ATPase [Acidimicrobiaceae bacterium]